MYSRDYNRKGGRDFPMIGLFVLIGGALLMAGVFLTYIKASIGWLSLSVSGWNVIEQYPIVWGVLAMGILTIFFMLIKFPLLAGLFALVGTICVVVAYAQVAGDLHAITGGSSMVSISIGVGAITSIIGGVMATICGLIGHTQV